MRHLYLLIGPSGSGKTTLADYLVRGLGLKAASSYTTRPRRRDDEGGHIFVNDRMFDNLSDVMVAVTEIDGCRYGVTYHQLNRSDIYVVDLKGAAWLKDHYTQKKLFIFGISASEDVCRARMRQRGDSEELIEKRIRHDREEFLGLKHVAGHILSGETSTVKLAVETFMTIRKMEGLENSALFLNPSIYPARPVSRPSEQMKEIMI